MSVSLRDVAKNAGVSVGTVSNVLNRPQIVASVTLRRVQKTIDSMGFVPNGFARHLRAGFSRTLGLVVPDVANPFFTEVARGVEDAANKHGYAVFLCNSDESAEKEERYLSVLIEHRVRGVLITPASDRPDRLDDLRERGIAVALLGRESTTSNQCSVSVDDVRGGEIGIQHLVSLGHSRIVWVNGSESIPQCADRAAGVAIAAKAAKVNVKTIRASLMNTVTGEEVTKEILGLDEVPTAIFCANDLLALGVMRALIAEGIKVPEHISILGYDDIAFAASAAVPLSSVAQPAYQLGVAAAKLILSECEDSDEHAHQQIRFQPQLIVRSSTSAIAQKYKAIAKKK